MLLLAPSLTIYGIAMVSGIDRAPSDLLEYESESVSGYPIEYSDLRYAILFLAEYTNVTAISAVCTTLFLGGHLLFRPLGFIEPPNNTQFGPTWSVIKVQLLFSAFVWLRGTLPQFCYNQFTDLEWKRLIPVSLLWIVMITFVPHYTLALAVMLATILVAFAPRKKEPKWVSPVDPSEPFDALASDYPVPPRPGQMLPKLAGVIRSEITAPTENGER